MTDDQKQRIIHETLRTDEGMKAIVAAWEQATGRDGRHLLALLQVNATLDRQLELM